MKNKVRRSLLWDNIPSELSGHLPPYPSRESSEQQKGARMQVTYIILDDAGDQVCSAHSLWCAVHSLAEIYGLHAQFECLEHISDLQIKRAAAVLGPIGFTVRQVVAD